MIYCVNYFDTVNMLVEFVEFVILGQIKKYVFTVTCQNNLGSVGRHLFFILFYLLLSAKLEIVVSGIRFRYFIFEISGKPSFVESCYMTSYAVFLPSLLSISTKS